jgi:5'-nucleotidase / UDP-sugar diphosphatase
MRRRSGVQAFRRSGVEALHRPFPNARTPERLNALVPHPWCRSVLPALLLAAAFGAAVAAPSGPIQLQTTLSGGDRARMGESETGDLAADALRAATGADIGLVAAGELRDAALPAGSVTVAQLQTLFENGDEPVTVLALTGATLRGALEVAVSFYPRKNKGFLQVSGVRFAFDPARPEGSRIVSRTVGGQPMQDGRQYRVAMSSSLAAGQYGYYRLWNRDKAAGPQGLTMAGALEQYLRGRQTLSLHVEGRIEIMTRH